MNPIYKFQLSVGGNTRQVYPVYKDDLAIDYALEQGEQFYRGKLSGKLTFQKDDYNYIRTRAFDTQFGLKILRSDDGGATWFDYWNGQFWKTDCVINEDDETVVVTPSLQDRYVDVLAGLEKEFDLINLAPAMQSIKLDKRPMIQVYVPRQNVIGCFLSGMWWEQECTPVSENDTITIEGQSYPALTHKYYFAYNKAYTDIGISGTMIPRLPERVMAEDGKYFDFTIGNYRYARYRITNFDGIAIYDVQSGVALWRNTSVPRTLEHIYSVNLSPNPDTIATGTVTLNIQTEFVYARYITDVESVGEDVSYPIPDDDLVANNRNYSRVLGYYFPNTILISDLLSATPTKWGLYQDGQYYVMPTNVIFGINESFPVARAAWGRVSIWFAFDTLDWLVEQKWRKEYTLKDAYPIWSVISVLLGKIAPGITHSNSVSYSQFLYGTNPISNIDARLFITPKSNLIAAGYDQPAQKAPITLKNVLDMLRNCFRCYWFIDDQNRFRVEHIKYFRNGGSYSGTPVIGVDLTKAQVSRNGKPWAFAKNQYQFDKPEMAARYQFGWMDDVTQLFEGYPIDIISKYVNPDKIEQVQIEKFTSDVDYILLNPSAVSEDGFVLLAPVYENGEYKLPYGNFEINLSNHILQNPYVAFIYLTRYYAFDMPAKQYSINGQLMVASGVKKLKLQSVNFPLKIEQSLFNLIKTGLGNGTIQKMSVNLSSRNANTTLMYDTE